MKNWIEVTDAENGKKFGLNFNNFDTLNFDTDGTFFKKVFFENMAVRPVVVHVKESYDEVKTLIKLCEQEQQMTEQIYHKISVEPIDLATLKALKHRNSLKSAKKK